MSALEVILVGGFCEVVELCTRCGVKVVGFFDSSIDALEGYDIPYLGTDKEALSNPSRFFHTPLVVVPDDPIIRQRIVRKYQSAGYHFASIISPDADISPTCKCLEGVVIQSGVVVTAKAKVGAFSKLNIGAKIFHDCQLEDFVTLAPGATLLGRVKVHSGSYIGASCTILPKIVIGQNCKVGAGAVVTHNVSDQCVVAGVPARRINSI